MSPSGDAAVGMMDAAYFVGRKELLDFFNDLLDLNLTKIEQTASGAVACQLTELIFPGSIPMTKVNWSAKSDYEFVQNYKLLQKAFSKHNVQRHVDVDKLIRAKYQDNLEFTQWLKAFYDQSGTHREDYDARAVRCKGKGGSTYQYANKGGVGGGAGAARKTYGAAKTAASPRRPGGPPARGAAAKPATGPASRATRPLRERAPANESGPPPEPDAELLKRNAELTGKVEELEQAVLDIEKERDFYFEKLRHVEIMCQVHQEKQPGESDPDHLVEKILKVLYATADETITVNDDGELVEGSAADLLVATEELAAEAL